MVFCTDMDLHPAESEHPFEPILLTVAQAARRLGVSEAFIHKLKRHDKITPVKLGQATRYRTDEIDGLAAGGVSF